MHITVDPELQLRCPGYRIIAATAEVANSATSPVLQSEIDAIAADIASRLQVADINTIPPIAATRAAYKACGKDPNRYRPSQEQLMRRIVRGLGLYTVNSIVDTGNLLSLRTGCSVGCFDLKKVSGEELTVSIGRDGEPYEGIGRGPLNIAGLPVVRDAAGGIGTPTSDNVRTCIEDSTTSLLLTIHLFDTCADAESIMNIAMELFSRHCRAGNIHHALITDKGSV